ncbi:FAD-binding oxidoreductase [Rhizobium rhizogenes]|uniref:NAD(P)/FAD-dependent oxidoreductase n=1 Tax=Rhizobium rhizogenes TaxID=359 RepID=UPI0022C833D8|nr:FAD-binding oxidoreductase [Rhizobium rhizogenes]MCZ7489100.1 FAD-binding oxidoreductase [Rhizobium rhizogenes]
MDITDRPTLKTYDVVIIGAGFYGCAIAEHWAKKGKRVLICERDGAIMERASAVNQARIHTGFHYPRSYSTALRSWNNFHRFLGDFNDAVVRDFKMLYAIAKFRTKVDPQRFYGMFEAMKAPISVAEPSQKALFSSDLISDVFLCDEFAFNYKKLRTIMLSRMESLPIEISLMSQVTAVTRKVDGVVSVKLSSGGEVESQFVYNVAYSSINTILRQSGLAGIPLKHELVEIALVEPPESLKGLGVTVMDGAYFSCMPYPAASLYSLTHVRYTPHSTWADDASVEGAAAPTERIPSGTRWRHMINDARRYLPSIEGARWVKSLYDVKTVLQKNEADDGRPILLREHDEIPGFYSVLGSKIDNIYDLIEVLK